MPRHNRTTTNMVQAQASSTMGQDVRDAQAAANPAGARARVRFDPESQTVVPIAQQTPAYATSLQYEQKQDGTLNLFIPQLATGAVGPGPLGFMDSARYEPDYFAAWESYSQNQDGKSDIRRARHYYRRDSLVYRCVKLLTQLANPPITVQCDNPQALETVTNWFEGAMPDSFRTSWHLERFLSGFVPTLKTLIPYVPKKYRSNKIPPPGESGNIQPDTPLAQGSTPAEPAADPSDPMTADEIEKATAALVNHHTSAEKEYKAALDQYTTAQGNAAKGLCSAERLAEYAKTLALKQYLWLKGQIPGAYTILDPLSVDMEGPPEMTWLQQPYLRVGGEMLMAIRNPTPQQAEMLSRMPVEIVQQIKAGADKVWLSPNICTITFKDKQPYERYPHPMVAHAFPALDMKWDLYAMDRATVNGVKNRILLVKVGNDTYPVFDGYKIAEVASLFQRAARTMTLFWNHAIELEWVEPNLDALKDKDKYTIWNNEIRTTFGIAAVLTGTVDNSTLGNNALNFKGLQKEVDEAQRAFLEFLYKEVAMLKTALNISADIQFKYDALDLQDPVKFWAVLVQAVMNGIIDHQTALETLGFHFPTIVSRMKDMNKLKKAGLFMPNPSANNLGPSGQPLPNKGGTPTGGKPANQPLADNNANKKGTSQPKMKAAARIVPINEDEYRIVVDADAAELDFEHRQDVAEELQAPVEWVLTKAEFEKDHGPIDFEVAWPDLEMTEVVQAVQAVPDVVKLYHKHHDNWVKDRRAVSSRGPLSAEDQASAKTLGELGMWEYAEKLLGSKQLAPKWDFYLKAAQHKVTKDFPAMPVIEQQALAVALTSLRAKKHMAKATAK